MSRRAAFTIIPIFLLAGAGTWIIAGHIAQNRLEQALQQEKNLLPEGASLNWKSAHASAVGTIRLTGVTFTSPGQPAISVGSIKLSHPSEEAGNIVGFGHIDATDINISQTSWPVEIGALSGSDLILDFPALMQAFQVLDTAATAPDPLAALPASLTLGKNRLRHLSIQNLKTSTDGLQLSINVGDFILNNFIPDQASDLKLRKLTVLSKSAPARRLSLDTVSLQGLSLANNVLEWTTPGINGARTLNIANMSLQDGTDEKSPLILSFQKLSDETKEGKDKITTHSSLDHLTLSTLVPAAARLVSLGYDGLLLDATTDGTIDPATHTLQSNGHANIRDMGQLNFSFDLSNVNAASDSWKQLLNGNANVQKLQFKWLDAGLVAHGIDAWAKTRNISPDEARHILETSITDQTPKLPAQFLRYVVNPGKGPLTITIAPPKPVSISMLVSLLPLAVSMPAMAGQFGFSVQAP